VVCVCEQEHLLLQHAELKAQLELTQSALAKVIPYIFLVQL
jgi:hypothetical protein